MEVGGCTGNSFKDKIKGVGIAWGTTVITIHISFLTVNKFLLINDILIKVHSINYHTVLLSQYTTSLLLQ